MGLHRWDNIITFVNDACDRVILLYNFKVIKKQEKGVTFGE